MEETRVAALAVYERASEDARLLARQVFCSIDANRDGRINYNELWNHFAQRGWSNFEKFPTFFNELDRNRDGFLDFYEFLALFYLMFNPGIPLCAVCRVYMHSVYFTCLHCNRHNPNSYDLCPSCYHSGRYFHEHNLFVDNNSLFQSYRQQVKHHEGHVLVVPIGGEANPGRRWWNYTFDALGTLLNLGGTAVAIGNLAAGGCTIL
ncbi:hypothetical protein F0562_035306 [Nyssa sinensis]|uniref:EF-hand domain-containing protein n=1 Tax=Nyssa sinensis TaxID=561372 RepID=A0A5J5A9V0_9ASTE|nr:hypothetical protein F0562_035306 [Nyssa sinensis]